MKILSTISRQRLPIVASILSFVLIMLFLFIPRSTRRQLDSVVLVEARTCYAFISDDGDTLYCNTNMPSAQSCISVNKDAATTRSLRSGFFVSTWGHVLTTASLCPTPDTIGGDVAIERLDSIKSIFIRHHAILKSTKTELDYYARTHHVVDENYNEVMQHRYSVTKNFQEADSTLLVLDRMLQSDEVTIECQTSFLMRHAHTTDTGCIVSTTSPLRFVRASKSLLLLQTTSERLPQYATRYVVYQFSPRYWAPSWSNLRALGFWQASPDSLILPSVAPEPLNFELTQHYEEGGPIVDVYGHLVGVKINGKMASHSEMLGILHEEKSLLNWWMSNLAGRFRNTIGLDTVLSVQTSQINQVLDIDNYADATTYKGTQRNGVPNGLGEQKRSDHYFGHFVNGKRQGFGIATDSTRTKYCGLWNADTLVSGLRIDSTGIFNGAFDQNKMPSGEGTYVNHLHTVFYEGYWNKGLRHGSGYQINASRVVESGKWEKGKFKGEQMRFTDDRIYGIDISRYQHEIKNKTYAINWAKIRATYLGPQGGHANLPISFVYIKATQGTTISSKYYSADAGAARRSGFKVGAYHFFSLKPAKLQAEYFLKVAAPRRGDLPPMLDLEPTQKQVTDMGGAEAMWRGVLTWLKIVEKNCGCKPILYVGQMFLNTYYAQAPPAIYDYPVWVARYSQYRPNVHLAYWQLTPYGRIEGIQGDVDINVFNGGKTAFEEFTTHNCVTRP